jgi:sugar phosphate isomerase/epimerase
MYRRFVLPAFLFLAMLVSAPAVRGDQKQLGPKMSDRISLQLYSLRKEAPQWGPEKTLDLVRDWGFKYVEVAGTFGLPADKFKALLAERGLVAMGGHFPYDRYKNDPEGVAREAKALGLPYAGCAWIAHKGPFDEEQCRAAAAVFNHAGEVLAREGIKFYYHNHGYEFVPYKDGTLFDLLAQETKPEYVSFQLDVLWAVLPGQDPAKLLDKYGSRWLLVHLKDLKKGVPTGDMSAKTDLTNDVTLGTGQVDWPAFFRSAEKAGVQYYFIEDESPTSVEQIPQSVKFLKSLQY